MNEKGVVLPGNVGVETGGEVFEKHGSRLGIGVRYRGHTGTAGVTFTLHDFPGGCFAVGKDGVDLDGSGAWEGIRPDFEAEFGGKL